MRNRTYGAAALTVLLGLTVSGALAADDFKTEAGFTIVGIELTSQVEASGIDAAAFQTVAENTKKGCPVSRALGAVGNITLKATLTPS